MDAVDTVLSEVGLPTDSPTQELDVRDLPPPKPLRNTLETLATLDAETILVQRNDRRPEHLYPKLDDRGYLYETIETENEVITVIENAQAPSGDS